MLSTEEEGKRCTGKNLGQVYAEKGFQVIHLPIKDFSIPKMEDLQKVVQQIQEVAKKGDNVLVHCFSGKGRTGLVLACLAKEVLNLTGSESINWLRKYIPGAVETPEQIKLVDRFILPKEPPVSDSESEGQTDLAEFFGLLFNPEEGPETPFEESPAEQDIAPGVQEDDGSIWLRNVADLHAFGDYT